ncbi:MAG: hypothetical protein J5709_05035 [Bacteroidales bacterium]|nr:hypothetical protein [Bacteroidales bacterium]
MKTVSYTRNAETSAANTDRKNRDVAKQRCEVSKTPENELLSVEEYFDMVWQRYLEKYEKLQG